MQTSISVWVKHWGFTTSHSDDVKSEAEIGIEVNQNMKGPGARGPAQALGANVKTVTALSFAQQSTAGCLCCSQQDSSRGF
jgi:hypothetical protein